MDSKLDKLLRDDVRFGYFKKAIEYEEPTKILESLKKIAVLFTYYYFDLCKSQKPKEEVWEDLVIKECIEGVNFSNLNGSPNANHYSALMKASDFILNEPIYTLKKEYNYFLPNKRLLEKFIQQKKSNETDIDFQKRFPKIILADIDNSNNTHLLRKKIAEKTLERFKNYLKRNQTPKSDVYVAFAGGTTILRLVSCIISSIDIDEEFYLDLKRLSPIHIVELADPSELLSSYGIMENTKATHFVFQDLKLSKPENYVRFQDLKSKIINRKIQLQAIYTGIGRPKMDNLSPSNEPLHKVLEKKRLDNYLFELNAIPYYTDEDQTEKSRKVLEKSSITPIEELDSEFKVILSAGSGKEKSIYNLIQYSINNPSKKLVTHIITDCSTFTSLLMYSDDSYPKDNYGYLVTTQPNSAKTQ